MEFDDSFFRSALWQNSLESAYPNLRFLENGLCQVRSYFGNKITNAPFHWPRLNPARAESDPVLLLPTKEREKASQIFQVLPLKEGYENLAAGFRPQFRKNLRRIERIYSGPSFSTGRLSWEKEGRAFYAILLSQYKTQHRNIPPSYRLLEELFARAAGNSMALYGLKEGNQLLAGVVLGFSGASAVQLWAASLPEARSQGAATVLLNFILQDLTRSHSFTSLNLGPSPSSDADLIFAKARWGGQAIAFQSTTLSKAQNSPVRRWAELGLPYIPDFLFRRLVDKLAGHTA